MNGKPEPQSPKRPVRELAIPLPYFLAMLGAYVVAFTLGWKASETISPVAAERDAALRLVEGQTQEIDSIQEALVRICSAAPGMTRELEALKTSVRELHESGEAAVAAARMAPEDLNHPSSKRFQDNKSLFIGQIDAAKLTFGAIAEHATEALGALRVELVTGPVISKATATPRSSE